MPGFGIKSVDNILNAIESAKVCELPPFIAALGIPLIGSTASKEIVKVFPDWNSFIAAVESNYHFWDIPNFGFEMHSAITRFNYTEAKELYDNYLTVNAVQPPFSHLASRCPVSLARPLLSCSLSGSRHSAAGSMKPC